MKAPDECINLDEINDQINAIDQDIITLIGKRADYVRAGTRIKAKNPSDSETEQLRLMLEARRQWADQNRLDPDLIESIFSSLIGYLSGQEATRLENGSDNHRQGAIDPSSLI